MYDILELTLHSDKLSIFDFLKNNPTKVLKNGDHYKFIYLKPSSEVISDFSYKGITVRVSDCIKEDNWHVVRDLPIVLASLDLIELLEELECYKLAQLRQGCGIELSGWLFDVIADGLCTEQETGHFIRILFLHGYNFEQVTSLFSAIVKRIELAGYFLTTASKLYKGVEFG